MTVENFINENLDAVKALIEKEIPNQKFDSHEFIRCFAKKFEVDYVKLLASYKDQPFKNVHLQIGNFLSKQAKDLKLQKNGKVISSNVFGHETESEEWIKLI